MTNKFKWLVASSAIALTLVGCGKDDKEGVTAVSKEAQNTFLFFSQKSTNDDGENVGDLYIHKMDSDKDEKLASDVVDGRFFYNMEKDYVLYLSDEDELYKVASGETKEKLAEEVSYFDGTSSNSVVLYQDEDQNLYTVDLDQEEKSAEKIASDVGDYKLDGKSIYYVSDDGDLNVYNISSREEKTVAEEVNSFDFNGKEMLYTDEDNMLFYKESDSEKSTRVTGDNVYLADVTKSGDDIYFISSEDDESTLNVVNKKDLGNVTKIASDVMNYKVVDGEIVYLTDDGNLFSKEKDSDTAKKLASDISSFLFSNGELYLSDEDNSLFRQTDDGTKKVATKVMDSYITDDGNVIYLNEDSELFVDDKKIESDVQSVSNLEDSVAFATDENKLYFLSSPKEEAEVISDDLDNYSTVTYLNKEIYRNALNFKDIAGYWKYEEYGSIFEIKQDGTLNNLTNDYSLHYDDEETASLTSFGATNEDDEYSTFELEGDQLLVTTDDEEVPLEKMTKKEAKETLAAYEKEFAEEQEREEAHETALAEEEATSAIESTLESYFDFFEDAMYYGDTSDMSETVSPSSSFYSTQKDYIESSYDKGNYVEENGNDITNYEKVNDNKYIVTVDEDYTVHKEDGTTKEAVYTNVYVVEQFEDGWYITGLN